MFKCANCNAENQDAKKFCTACGYALSTWRDMPDSLTAHFPSDDGLRASSNSTSTTAAFIPGEAVANNYRIIGQLGQGGMGVVFKAEDLRLKRIVALKFLRTMRGETGNLRTRLVQEAQTAASLMHPNIATIFELGKTADEFEFISMEYISGTTLKKEIEKRQLSFEEVLSMFSQICQGLAAAHGKGIIHRDIKTSNIMLSDSGVIKITDFGLAQMPGIEDLTEPGVTVGTIGYMAPEQLSGQPASRLTDIWSIGVVLYEMLTGRLPFVATSWPSMIKAVTTETPIPVSKLRSDIPEHVETLVALLLEKDPNRRPSTIEELTAVSGLSAVGTEFSATTNPVTTARLRRPSVAVLPFANRSADPEKEFFSAGLADELISALASMDTLHVVARSSSFSFQGREIDIREIGRQLDVETIIEGSVRWSNQRLRIAVQAVEVSTGYQIWSQVFDRQFVDIFDIQEETALAIVEKLQGQIQSHEKKQLKRRPTENVEAFESYLQGKFFLNSMNPTMFEKGMELQQRAIDEDPEFQLAFVEIAEAHCRMAEWDVQPARQAYPEALKWATNALAIDESSAETHACLGSIHTHFTWDWKAAENHLRRAVELNGNLAMAHDRFAEFLRYTGKWEKAIAEATLARDLDPLSPSTNWTLAATLAMCGQPERALPLAKKNVEMFSSVGFMYFLLAMVQESLDRDDDAQQSLVDGLEVSGPLPELVCLMGFIYGKTGQPEKANECLNRLTALSKTRYVAAFAYAMVHAGLRQTDRMFEYLEQTFEDRSWQMILIKNVDYFDFAKNDPRFDRLLEKIGLPETGNQPKLPIKSSS